MTVLTKNYKNILSSCVRFVPVVQVRVQRDHCLVNANILHKKKKTERRKQTNKKNKLNAV